MNSAINLIPCPFCGNTSDINDPATFETCPVGDYGAVVCDCNCSFPAVSTKGKSEQQWKAEAILAANVRFRTPVKYIYSNNEFIICTKDGMLQIWKPEPYIGDNAELINFLQSKMADFHPDLVKDNNSYYAAIYDTCEEILEFIADLTKKEN